MDLVIRALVQFEVLVDVTLVRPEDIGGAQPHITTHLTEKLSIFLLCIEIGITPVNPAEIFPFNSCPDGLLAVERGAVCRLEEDPEMLL